MCRTKCWIFFYMDYLIWSSPPFSESGTIIHFTDRKLETYKNQVCYSRCATNRWWNQNMKPKYEQKNSNFRPSALSRNANNGRWRVHLILPRKQFGGRLEISHTLKLNPVLMLVLLLTSMWAPDFALFLWTPMVCPKK